MKPAVSSLVTSSVMAWSHSGAKALHLCWTGFLCGSTFNLCWIIFGDMPDMSSWLHAKTTRFSFRNSISLVLISGLSIVPILVVLVVPSSTSATVSKASTFYSLPLQSSMYGSPSWPGQSGSILWLKLDLLLPRQLRYLLRILLSDNRWTLPPFICWV